ncbi:sigma-70 family RNA polymerase sigma factor [Sediminibacillus albus]|uniref:RNA polymerase sigma factor n=1 Tax=Sediminibacillus albus TaxID=407036 RepID=A0A1G9A2M0_9BACI|nr:sigma-70 family RNA polymerase sigma factor [Sediminibacillus albus]SDK21501.1 RNA polymerase sigma-70 factor, ECF subfamily [Sediminibacillus albus]
MDNQSLDTIYRSYMIDIYRYLLSLCGDSYLAEDIVQETFLRAFLYIEDINNINNIKPWLFSVAYHTFVDVKRKAKFNVIKEDYFFGNIMQMDSPEKKVILKKQVQEIRQIINKMKEKQKHAILLVDFHQLSYQEAATVMSVNVPHLKVLLFRARKAVVKRQYERSKFDE